MPENDKTPEVRLDKWLKVARFFKSRADATEAVENGQVKLNGERTKPAKIIKIGDLLTIKMGNRYRDFTVKVITARSLSAKLARELYEAKEPEGITPEMSELIAIHEEQEKQSRRDWRGMKEDKKKRRDVSKFKYREE